MAVIGATQLEPVNVLGQYVQGLEAGRATRRQRAADEAAMLEAQRAAELRNFLSTADLSKPDVQNQLLRFGKPGADVATSLADFEGKRATAKKTGLEARGLEVKIADENYGRFQNMLGNLAYGEAPPNKAQVLDQVEFMIAQGTIAPQFRDYATSTLSDDPAMLQKQLRGQFLAGVPAAERAKLFVPRSPEVFAQDLAERAAGAPRTQLTTTNIQERAEAGKFGESLVADFATIRERADAGRRFLTTIDQAQRALNEGLRTGFGADAVRQGARVLAALGEPEAEKKAANAELFLAAGKENVLRRQIEQKGPQTESDAARIEETFIGLGTTPKANEFMLDVARAQIRRDGEQQRFYSRWRRETGSFDGAEEAWLDGEGGRSLFDRPELKKYATGARGRDEVVKVKTADEARALPPGTRFMTPDGRIKVR
jgi:hypothetical protein